MKITPLREVEIRRISEAGSGVPTVAKLPRIPKRRSSQNDLKANFAEINFYEVRAY
jgi:hypothetical protein